MYFYVCRKETVKLSAVSMRDNENITATEENTVEYETVDIGLASTRQCNETLEYEHISAKQCSDI